MTKNEKKVVSQKELTTQLSKVRSAINLKINEIVAGDVKSLTVIPGIGAKTAKRIIVELKEKFEADNKANDELGFMDDSTDSNLIKNVKNALESLGYKSSQINNTIKELNQLGELTGSIEEVIKKALSKMI